MKIESNRKGYESLHSYLKPLMTLHKPWAYKQKFKVSPLVQEYVYNKQNLSALWYNRRTVKSILLVKKVSGYLKWCLG